MKMIGIHSKAKDQNQGDLLLHHAPPGDLFAKDRCPRPKHWISELSHDRNQFRNGSRPEYVKNAWRTTLFQAWLDFTIFLAKVNVYTVFLVTPPLKKWQSPSREIERFNVPL